MSPRRPVIYGLCRICRRKFRLNRVKWIRRAAQSETGKMYHYHRLRIALHPRTDAKSVKDPCPGALPPVCFQFIPLDRSMPEPPPLRE